MSTCECTDKNLESLLDTPVAVLLSKSLTGSLEGVEEFWDALLNGTLNDLLNILFKKSLCDYSSEGSHEMAQSGILSKVTVRNLLCSLSNVPTFNEQKVMVKSKGKKLYVGKGLAPGAVVNFYLPIGYYLSFTKNLNRYSAGQRTPLRLVRTRNSVLIGDKLEPPSTSPGLIECMIDKGYKNINRGQPDFFYFSIRKIGGDGNANDPSDASDLRVAVLSDEGDVKSVEFYLYSSPNNWFQRVTLKAINDSPRAKGDPPTLALVREADIFNSLRGLVNSYGDLSNLDIVDVQHADSITHFDDGPGRITFDADSKRQCVARLNWPKHEAT